MKGLNIKQAVFYLAFNNKLLDLICYINKIKLFFSFELYGFIADFHFAFQKKLEEVAAEEKKLSEE